MFGDARSESPNVGSNQTGTRVEILKLIDRHLLPEILSNHTNRHEKRR